MSDKVGDKVMDKVRSCSIYHGKLSKILGQAFQPAQEACKREREDRSVVGFAD